MQSDYTVLRDGWSWGRDGEDRKVIVGRPVTMREARRNSVEVLWVAVQHSPGPWALTGGLTEADHLVIWTRVLEAMGEWRREGWQGEEDLRLAMSCPEILVMARLVEKERKVDLLSLMGVRTARLVAYHSLFDGERDLYTDRSWVAEDWEWGRRGGEGHLCEDVRDADGRQVFDWRVKTWVGQEVVKVGVEEGKELVKG